MNPSPMPRATVLTVLFLPAAAVGGFLGVMIGAISGAAYDTSGGWAALGWALLGGLIGAAVFAGLLGWIWAIICNRRRLLPALGLVVLAGGGSVGALMVATRLPSSDEDAVRLAATIAIGVAALALTFWIGVRTPARPTPPAPGYPPPAQGYPRPAPGYLPTAQGYPPPAQGYPPPAQGYIAPQAAAGDSAPPPRIWE